MGGGVATSIKVVAEKVPVVGPALLAIEGISLYQRYKAGVELEKFIAADEKKEGGVLVIEWAIGGARAGNGSWNTVQPWNGTDDPF